jgi:hypothetical protein
MEKTDKNQMEKTDKNQMEKTDKNQMEKPNEKPSWVIGAAEEVLYARAAAYGASDVILSTRLMADTYVQAKVAGNTLLFLSFASQTVYSTLPAYFCLLRRQPASVASIP